MSVEKRVAITLWCLATPCEYRTVSHLFSVAWSTVCSIVQDTCRAIVRQLINSYIQFTTGEALVSVVEGFERIWGFPQCAGAIDGSHIPICAPRLNHTDYYNRKGWYSMIVQAVVNNEYVFRDICVGWPGSVHNARVFANSKIFKRIIQDGLLAGEGTCSILGHEVPFCIIGDCISDSEMANEAFLF